MKKHNILTWKDRRSFSMRRNGALGQLHMARNSILTMLSSDLVDDADKIHLKVAHDQINNVLKHWDKHYCAKLFAKLNEEANNNE